MNHDEKNYAAPLCVEMEDGAMLEFARPTMRQWGRWKARLAGSARSAVLRAMLKDLGERPECYKVANDELTRRRTLPEIAEYVTNDPSHIRRFLVEQAVAAGHDKAEASTLVDRIGAWDKRELASLLANEAVFQLPLLLPLSRNRARAAEQMAKQERARSTAAMIVAGMFASPTAVVPTLSGNTSGSFSPT